MKFITITFCVLIIILHSIDRSRANDSAQLTDDQGKELIELVKIINHSTLPYKTAVLQSMVTETDFFVSRLNLLTPQPITPRDVKYPVIFDPWYATFKEKRPPFLPATAYGADICNTNIPRAQRLKSLKITVSGVLETTNYFLSFKDGWLCDLEHLSEHGVEYYAHDLDKLLGKTSLIDTNGAFQLATQWLAAVDVNVPALMKRTWTVNQLRYLPLGSTNTVLLPLYYVDFGSNITQKLANEKPLTNHLFPSKF